MSNLLDVTENTVTLRLGGLVSVDEFAERAELWARMLAALAQEESRESQIRWQIADLSYSSAILTAEPQTEDPVVRERLPRLVDHYLAVAREVQSGHDDPNRPLLRLVHNLIEKATPEADITFETPEDEVTFEGAMRPLDMKPTDHTATLGTVRGRVETLSQHRGLRFTIYDLLTDRAVSCYIEPGHEEQLRDAWGRLADVTGMVKRDSRSSRPVSIRRVSRVEVIPDRDPDTYLRARGIVTPKEGAPKSGDLLRQLRDAG